MSFQRTIPYVQGKDSSKGNKKSKSSSQEGLSTSSKNKNKTMDRPGLKLEPFNIFEPSLPSPGWHTSPSPSSEPQVHGDPIKDSRKGKGFVNDLTTDVDVMALYHGMVPKKLDHYVGHILVMAHEK